MHIFSENIIWIVFKVAFLSSVLSWMLILQVFSLKIQSLNILSILAACCLGAQSSFYLFLCTNIKARNIWFGIIFALLTDKTLTLSALTIMKYNQLWKLPVRDVSQYLIKHNLLWNSRQGCFSIFYKIQSNIKLLSGMLFCILKNTIKYETLVRVVSQYCSNKCSVTVFCNF